VSGNPWSQAVEKLRTTTATKNNEEIWTMAGGHAGFNDTSRTYTKRVVLIEIIIIIIIN